ncbi:MAG: hypothetical protein SVK54_06315 [candidate division WOR-3 bacterium]|nr:hypothetical protein [candidate division WOR-3 bacterium]
MTDLLLIKLKSIKRSLFAPTFRSVIQIITYIAVIMLFLLGTYFIFGRIFSFLTGYEEIGRGLIYRIFSLMFSMFFILLILSSIVSSISTFFRTPELEFLFSTPVKISSVFFIKLIENGFFASWATSIISFPLVLALGNTFNMPFLFYVKAISLFILFIIISTSIGLAIVFIFSSFFLRHSKGGIILILILILMAMTLMFLFGKAPQIFNMPRTASLSQVNQYIASLEIEQFRHLPSGLVSNMMFALIDNKPAGKSFTGILLYLGAIIPLLFISLLIYRKRYLAFGQKYEKKTSIARNRMHFPLFMKDSKQLLFIQKDIVSFIRDPSQWGQSLIFLVLLTFYIFSLIRTPIYFKTPFFTYIIAFANMGFSAYIAATLSVRFIYPMISLEGRTFNLIKMTGHISRFFTAKLIFNFILVFILAELLVTGTNIFLDLDMTIIIISLITIFILSVGITIINIGIGAIFPEFRQTNPSKIASGFGGIIAGIFSLTYVGISLGFLAGPIRLYFENSFQGIEFNYNYFVLAIAAILLITIIISAILFPIARRKLRTHYI